MIKALQQLAASLGNSRRTESSFIAFKDSRYKAVPFSKDSFHPLAGAPQEGRLAFIDGGNIEVLKAPDKSVQLVRVYYNIFDSSGKRLQQDKVEFFASISTEVSDEGIHYTTELLPFDDAKADWLPEAEDLKFSIYEDSLSTGGFQVSISRIGETARRFAEWAVASKLAEQLQEGDAIVRDGTLQSSVKGESKYINQLYEKAAASGVAVAGIAKTSSLLTNTGASSLTAISSMAPEGEWIYHPLAKIEHPDHRAELFFVKLNKDARHSFRFEIYNEQADQAQKVLALLRKQASDAAFPGYPYGLVDADKNARATHKEKAYLKALLLQMMSKEAAASLAAADAHEVIDEAV